jgi:UDP-apiose/xylose synthase
MKVLLLGAGGFIGSHLVEHLLAETGHEVIGLDLGVEKLDGIATIQNDDRFEFHHTDIRTAAKLLDNLVRRCDVVVDLIAYANPSIYVSAPLEVFELNFVQNMNVVTACVAHRKRLIQYSSAEVYGKAGTDTHCREDGTDSVFGPVGKQRWIYATAKLMLERLLYAHGVAGDLEYTIVRPFNFVGSRIDYLVPADAVRGPRVFPHFMSALLTGGPIRLVDGGAVHRTFLHIEDANRAFRILLERTEDARNQIFNVGNPGNNITIRELAMAMIEIYEELTGQPARSQVVTTSGEAFYGPGYEDGDRRPPDISKLRALGWAPQHDLRSTLRDAMLYYLDESNAEANRGYANVSAPAPLLFKRPRIAVSG